MSSWTWVFACWTSSPPKTSMWERILCASAFCWLMNASAARSSCWALSGSWLKHVVFWISLMLLNWSWRVVCTASADADVAARPNASFDVAAGRLGGANPANSTFGLSSLGLNASAIFSGAAAAVVVVVVVVAVLSDAAESAFFAPGAENMGNVGAVVSAGLAGVDVDVAGAAAVVVGAVLVDVDVAAGVVNEKAGADDVTAAPEVVAGASDFGVPLNVNNGLPSDLSVDLSTFSSEKSGLLPASIYKKKKNKKKIKKG
ncbi:hypothetical protein BC940DRAFT_98098 [Gongronella butleri]|nr:hypothetical protein BC940DRAFT_98098 [Gongronella butleri]